MFDNNQFGKMLDEGLRSYSAQEPLIGLEQRVLERVRFSKRRRLATHYGLGALGLAAVGLFFLLLMPFRKEEAPHLGAIAVASAPPLRDAVVRSEAHKRKRIRPSRLNQFPTPSPMTAAEKALLAIAERQETLPPLPSEPIELTPIQIKPLEIQSLEQQER